MPNSDSESEALLPKPPPRKPSAAYREAKVSDTSTETTTISEEDEEQEVFMDFQTKSIQFARFDQADQGCSTWGQESTQSGSSNADLSLVSQPGPSSELQQGVEKCIEAFKFQPGDFQSSSDDSNKKTLSGQSSVDLGYILEYQVDESGNLGYIEVDFNTSICEQDVVKLMKKLRINHYTAISCEGDSTLSKCMALFERDYQCVIVPNSGGSLSRNYPPRLIVPVAERKNQAQAESLETIHFDAKQYTQRVKKSVSSRLRTRFVVPVMLLNDKFICRSGTLSVRKSAVYETARMPEPPKEREITSSKIERIASFLANLICDASSRGFKATYQLFIPGSMEKIRDVDAQIIRDLKIQHICDLMIEDRKMFKQVIRVSSSEKINKNIYKDCSIEQMPYPGCKMFANYQKARYNPEGLIFNWNRPDANVEMMFSEDPSIYFPDICWSNYKEWDLVDLTKNYLRMLLLYIAKGHGSLLVHCISGWDRTPLFISILRASLWADGVIHQSLNYKDMAYLTLAYDWYLFGHNLPNRLEKKQEIMHFCFKFLPYIISDDFSITKIFHDLPPDLKGDRTFKEFNPQRRDKLHFLSVYVLGVYFENITMKMEKATL